MDWTNLTPQFPFSAVACRKLMHHGGFSGRFDTPTFVTMESNLSPRCAGNLRHSLN
jgi:hypothetical protein